MVTVGIIVVLLLCSSKLWISLGMSVRNFKGDETPYHIGLCLFIVAVVVGNYLATTKWMILYLGVLWLTGMIDDRFGTTYPKGLKGHLRYFVKTKKITTGLLKLGLTFSVALLFSLTLTNHSLFEQVAIFLMLLLTPHIMNLFDTRPLRVWKVSLVHFMMFAPIFLQITFDIQLFILVMASLFIYFEGTRRGMLGDNGATVVGGIVSLLVITHLSVMLVWFLILLYVTIIFAAERISLSKWIEASPILKKIDRWGVS